MEIKMVNYDGKDDWFNSLANSFLHEHHYYVKIGTTIIPCHSNEKMSLENFEIIDDKIAPTKEKDGRCVGIFELLPGDDSYHYPYSSNVDKIYVEIDECNSCEVIEVIKTSRLFSFTLDERSTKFLKMYLVVRFDKPEGCVKIRIMKEPKFWFRTPKKTDHYLLESLTLHV